MKEQKVVLNIVSPISNHKNQQTNRKYAFYFDKTIFKIFISSIF